MKFVIIQICIYFILYVPKQPLEEESFYLLLFNEESFYHLIQMGRFSSSFYFYFFEWLLSLKASSTRGFHLIANMIVVATRKS